MKKLLLIIAVALLLALPVSSELTTWNGNEWNKMSRAERYAFSDGFILALYTMGYDIRTHVPGDTSYLEPMLIRGVSGPQLAQFVDELYRNPNNREIPVAIALYMNEKLVRNTGGNR